MGEAIKRLGSIVYVSFPEQVPPGVEQKNLRPAIIVSFPDSLGIPRYPICIVIPISSSDSAKSHSRVSPELYMFLVKGTGNLTKDSVILLDQIRAVDLGRIKYFVGNLPIGKYKELKSKMRKLFSI